MLDNKKIFIVDDSSIILHSLKMTLVRLGAQEKNITTDKSPKTASLILKEAQFDLMFIDYNFGLSQPTGLQFLEELRHFQLLAPKTLVVILTGEAQLTVVQSIIEYDPDEYFLKPFTFDSLKQRLRRALKRKEVMLPVQEHYARKEYQLGVEACDHIASFHPNYSSQINQFKAKMLRMLGKHQEVKSVCESSLQESDSVWARFELSKSLINLGDFERAEHEIEQLLKHHAEISSAHIGAGEHYISTSNIEKAVKHFRTASVLAPNNALKELIISNLCLSAGDVASSLKHYKCYMDMNRNTFRLNHYAKLNYIRLLMISMQYADNDEVERKLSEVDNMIGSFNAAQRNELRNQLALVSAHKQIALRQYRQGIEELIALFDATTFHHFSDIYHLTWLCHYISDESGSSEALTWLFEAIPDQADDCGLNLSQIEMAKALKKSIEQKSSWLAQTRSDLKHAEAIETRFKILANVHLTYPTLKYPAFNLIRLMTRYQPETSERLLQSCITSVKTFMDAEEYQFLAVGELVTFAMKRQFNPLK
ncbi:response regulator [Vibrio aquaticus]|uniref:Response regulator n=1 Tax=Vibrio aquaticus TaxID=2496559 RepID=A0A3S0PQC8_9VIBR|nr:response regulator [Vibrio aquaticus]RTZ17526.1 response regulator [Vibrio aquaticus]